MDGSGTIREETRSSGGRYVLARNGAEAELGWSRVNDRLVIVDHTGVPDSMRGTGAGLELARHTVEQARAGGWQIIPLCPFFKAQAMRHPDWADVVQGMKRD